MDRSRLPAISSRWADLTPSPVDNKSANGFKTDLPARKASTPQPTSNGNPNGVAASYLLPVPKSIPTTRNNTPGPKKLIKWHGRSVIIQMPAETPAGRPPPLSKEEVEKRMKEWVAQGYSLELGGQGSCRDIFPEEKRGKVSASEVFVNIPDPREWEAHVNALREEKLRALGVILDDGPPPPQPGSIGNGGGSPLSHLQSPGMLTLGLFSPPPPTTSAMSNPHSAHPHGPFNPFSPISIPANGTPGPPPLMSPAQSNNHFAFHLPRQSVSISGTPSHPNEWEPMYGGMYTPPVQQQQQSTPPSLGGSGVWSPPFNMRNSSPGMVGGMPMHGHSASQFNLGYPVDNPMDPYAPHHGLVGQERFHQQQMRRGSPLAQVRHPMELPHAEMPYIGPPPIDAPVPKHRHQLSVTLQKEFENTEDYQREEARKADAPTKDTDGEGFATNPVSPAPIMFPSQPDIPNPEMDIHNGPELASNPDDDVSDIEVEKQKNRHEAQAREDMQSQYNQEIQSQPLPQQFMPQSQYAHPHSRQQSLSQLQHEYDNVDPVQNSAMSMMMAGEGLGAGIHDDELLSEDGRTNISDIVTNPSEPSSPRPHHAHHLSGGSSAWVSEHTKNALSSASSASRPKFNAKAAEFRFDPSTSFTFVPGSNPFSPTSQMASTTSPVAHPQDHGSGPAGGFGNFGGAFGPGSFQPSSANSAHYRPNAPVFTPSFAAPAPPPPVPVNSIFDDIVKPPSIKKVIPIVRPPSRDQDLEKASLEKASESLESKPEGGKPDPAASKAHDTEAPASPETEDKASESSDEGEQLMKAPIEDVMGSFVPFEFQSKAEAEDFANAAPPYESAGRQGTKTVDFFGSDTVLSPDEAFVAAQTPREPSSLPTPEPADQKPTAQEFNFEFPKTASPPRKVLGPSPPPSEPAPPLPFLPDSSVLLPPRSGSPHGEDAGPEKVARPSLTDSQIDEVIKYMDQTDTVFLRQHSEDEGEEVSGAEHAAPGATDDQSSWKQESPSQTSMPLFNEKTPHKAGHSPSPHRGDLTFHHRASSFSPDEPEPPIHVIGDHYTPEDIGVLQDADSDWDAMLSDGNEKLRPQSRLFFDAHVEELVGALFQRRLDPVLNALATINNTLRAVAPFSSTGALADYEHSDADDEDDTMEIPPKSLRGRKLEKIKAALSEVLALHQIAPPISEEILQEIREALSEGLMLHQSVPAVSEETLQEIKTTLIEALASQKSAPSVSEGVLEKVKDAVSEALKSQKAEPPISGETLQEIKAALSASQQSALGVSGDILQQVKNAVSEVLASQKAAPPTSEDALGEIKASLTDVAKSQQSAIPISKEILQEIKAALSKVLTSQQSASPISKEILQEIKDAAIVSNGYTHEFAEVKSSIAAILSKAARSEDIAPIRATMEDVSRKISQGTELAELKATVMEVMQENAQFQEEAIRTSSRTQVEALHSIAKSREVTAVRDTVRKDVLTLKETLRDAVDEIVTNVGDRVDDAKFLLQDVSTRAVQRSDIADVKAAIVNSMGAVARKEDLVPIHHVLSEVFSKSAKTDELTDLNRMVEEVMGTVLKIDIKPTHQEVLRLKQESDQYGAIIQEVLRLAQDNSANMEFHHVANQETVREGNAALNSRMAEVYSAVREMTKFAQSHASKNDMRRNLAEQEQKQDAVAIKKSIADTNLLIQESFDGLGKTQPTLSDIRSVVETLADRQLKVQDFKPAMDEVAATLPALDDIKRGLGEVIKADSRIDELRKAVEEDRQRNSEEFLTVVEEDRLRNMEEFRTVVEADRMRNVEEIRSVADQVVKAQPTLEDFRTLMEDVIAQQQLFVPVNFDSPDDVDSKEQLKLKIETLERDVAHFQKRGDEEAERKRRWQEKTIEMEKKLKLAEEEEVKQRELAEDKDRRLRVADEKRQQTLKSAQLRSALLEGAHSSLQKANGDLSAKNAELEGTIREAQASEEKHRAWNLQLENENKELRKSIEAMKTKMEESIKVRESFRTKFDRVQEDMRRVTLEIGQEQVKWKNTHGEQKARIEVLEAKLDAEVTKSQGLEGEVRRLEVEEKEAIRLRVETDQLRRANVKSEELITELRHESIGAQSRIVQLTHEVDQTRETAGDEVNRVRWHLQNELDTAKAETSSVRGSLEKEVEIARSEIARVSQEAAAEKEKLEHQLEEVQTAKATELQEAELGKAKALREAAEAKSAALHDQHRKFERQVEEVRKQHERAYRIVTEDAERDQYFLQERLNIAQNDAKNLREHIESLQAQVKTLNENFKIANSAAQAAAQAATTVREMTAPQLSDDRALRESVHVLQSQLQERESRIDQLESELAELNASKSKVREVEGQLNMYRELLDLRINDLEEIIHTCSLQHLDRGSLRDAATRLKASLEMQFHEKERAMGVAKPEDKIAAVQIAASKLPGVASAAWQNWRNRGKTSNEATPKDTPSPTPSRPSSVASGFLNGILTPPSNTVASARRFGAGFGRGPSSVVDGSVTPRAAMSAKQLEKRPTHLTGRRPGPPASSTSHLFRRDNYDADADSSVLSGEFYDDEDDATETAGDQGDMEPFGLSPYSRGN